MTLGSIGIARRLAAHRRAIAIPLAAGAMVLAFAAGAAADSPDPLTIDVEQDGYTVTLTGTWEWPQKNAPCGPGTRTNRAAGWAVDWDEGFTGNAVPSKKGPAGLMYHMGSADDNLVNRSSANNGLGDCGVAADGGGVTGTWGPISYTYAAPGTYEVCVLLYDVRYKQSGGQTVVYDTKQLVAGGSNRNRDNSAETNYYSTGKQCAASTIVIDPAELTLTKSATQASYDAVGDVIDYEFLVENTGETTIAGPVTIDDDLTADESCPAVTTVGDKDADLDPGESLTCTATYTVTQDDLDAGQVDNAATASADGVTSNESTASVPAQQERQLDLTKTADPGTYRAVGDVIDYTFVVENIGNVTLAGPVTIDDDLTTDESCPALTTIGDEDGDLDVGESVTCTASYTIDATDIANGTVTNSATASADDVTSNEDSATVESDREESLRLVKRAEQSEYAQVAGDVLDYTFTVTNNGNVRLAGPVTIDDSRTTDESCPAVSTVGNEDGFLDPDESIVCTASYTTTEEDIEAAAVGNVATATADGVTSNEGRVTVKMAPTLAVVMDSSGSVAGAAPTTIRRYNALLATWKARTSLAPWSLTLFSTERYTQRYIDRPIPTVPRLTTSTYSTGGRSNIYDSVDKAIRQLLARNPKGTVVFTIATDFVDNASKNVTKGELARLIRRMESQYGWS
ncbi:MAG: hypothetical protein ACKOTZ_05005, partial [Chloroflexota bacterium]